MKKALILRWLVNEETKTIIASISLTDAPDAEKDNLKFFYDKIECQMIDVVRFDGFDAFCDDEGLLTSGNAVIEYSHGDFKVPIAGNLVFTNGVDNMGRTLWFDDRNPDDMVTMSIIHMMIEEAEVKGVSCG